MSGCSLPEERADFDSISPAEQTRAIVDAARDRDRAAIPDLINELESSDPAARMLAIATLRELTNQDLGYHPTAAESERRLAIVRWRQWNAQPLESAPEAEPSQPADASPARRESSAGPLGMGSASRLDYGSRADSGRAPEGTPPV